MPEELHWEGKKTEKGKYNKISLSTSVYIRFLYQDLGLHGKQIQDHLVFKTFPLVILLQISSLSQLPMDSIALKHFLVFVPTVYLFNPVHRCNGVRCTCLESSTPLQFSLEIKMVTELTKPFYW